MGFTILCISDIFALYVSMFWKMQLPLQCIFWQSLRRFVLIDLVDQIFKLESRFYCFDKTVSNKLMIPAWWFVFVFS
jgi:hypothetical protein